MRKRNGDAAFFVLGLTFVAIGTARHSAFLVVGLFFIVVGAARMARAKRQH